MVRKFGIAVAVTVFAFPCHPQTATPSQTALTIYNQDFAVVRTAVDLDLKPGSNEVTTTDVTGRLEPDSVVLRDPAAQRTINVVEQNYDAGLVDQQSLLQKFQGKTIDFMVSDNQQGSQHIVPGRIIRAPDVNGGSPLIEVNGKMQFSLPGLPLFPASTDGLLLTPTLRWQLNSERAAHYPAELDYITQGFTWEASYNVVAPSELASRQHDQEEVELIGWVTIQNNSGTAFRSTGIQLMAGDVSKLKPILLNDQLGSPRIFAGAAQSVMVNPAVTQQAFDDFHLYDLHRTMTLRDRETKQVQFLHAASVAIRRLYEYDGANLNPNNNYGYYNNNPAYGVEPPNTKVRVVQEFKNSEANHLGIPLPAGKLRFYRREANGQTQFTGENLISHTPANEPVRVVTGSAFDLLGDRKRTDFKVDDFRRTVDESFDIRVKNQKNEATRVDVVEHLSRSSNWQISAKSDDYKKQDSSTVKFELNMPAKSERTITYTVHYFW